MAIRHRPWYAVSTPEQKRALEAENWRRQIEAQLFRSAHTEGTESASAIIQRTASLFRKNPLGPKDEPAPLLDESARLGGARAEPSVQPRKRAGVPLGVAEAFPEEAAGRRTYGTPGSTGEAGEFLKDIAKDKPIVSDERLPGPARTLVEELTRPSNLLVATGGPAKVLSKAGPVGRVAAKVVQPTAGGFARRLITEAGASAGARTAVQETGERLPEDTNPAVGFAAQLVAGLAGGAAGGGLAATAPRAATRYRDITASVPVGASIKNVGEEAAAEEAPSVIQRFTDVIRQAKPLRSQTARLQSAERGKRIGTFSSMREGGGGEAGALKARSALGGELPKMEFEPPRGAMESQDIDELFNISENYDWGRRQWNQVDVENGLFKTLSGQVPNNREIRLMEQVYGEDFAKAILDQRSLGAKARELAMDVANVPRALMSALDISGILRQGAFLIGHPTRFAKTVPSYIRAMASEKYALAVDESIRTAPFAAELEDAGLYIAGRVGRATSLTDREEAFMSRLVSAGSLKARTVKAGIGGGIGYATGDTEEERRRNALIGATAGFASPTVIKASERGYVTFLNKLRSDVSHDIMKNWDDSYREAQIHRLASFVNAATGRGDLKGVGKLGPALNAFFFSPRFLYSRFQLGAAGVRAFGTLNDPLSRTIAKDTAAFVATGLTAMKLLEVSGQATVELDPRSSDFGKVKIGNTRYDFWGGYQQIARYTAQMISGERKTSDRGDIVDANRMETFGRFIQSKLAPVPGAAVDIARGEKITGEEVTATKGSIESQAWERLAPLFIQDLQEAADEEGARGVFKTLPSGLGVGVTTYSSNADLERKIAGEQFPGVPFEQLSRDQLRAVRATPKYQERLDQGGGKIREQAKTVFAKQQYDDAELKAGRMTQAQWSDRRTKRNAEYGGFLLAETGGEPIQNPRNPYEEYLNVLRNSQDPGGQIDFDKVEEWLNAQSSERQSQIEARTGLSDTPYVAERRNVSDSLRKAGFFELRDVAWNEMKSRFKGKVKAEAEQFATYDEYRTELIQQLAERLSSRMDMETALKRAETTVDSHPVIANYQKRLRYNRARWAKTNSGLSQQAINYGFLSPSELNLKASGALTRTPVR